MQALSEKENTVDEEAKTNLPKNSKALGMRKREFGRELTNTNEGESKEKKNKHHFRPNKACKISSKST